jgi:hypothetical protein
VTSPPRPPPPLPRPASEDTPPSLVTTPLLLLGATDGTLYV